VRARTARRRRLYRHLERLVETHPYDAVVPPCIEREHNRHAARVGRRNYLASLREARGSQ
jgi:hypothetical protein